MNREEFGEAQQKVIPLTVRPVLKKRSQSFGKICSITAATALLLTNALVVEKSYAAKEEVPLMDKVVVTATRNEQQIKSVPANVTTIDREDIDNSNAVSIVDLLRQEEGIVIRNLLGNGKSAQVDLRGFGETGAYNTLVLVDGRRVNNIDLSGVDWAQISLDSIERVEIVRGSGSVLYGDNTSGGVINIITRFPSEKLSVSAGALYGSYDQTKGHVTVGGSGENISATVTISGDHTNGYRENTEYTSRDLSGKIIYEKDSNVSFYISGSLHEDENGLPGSVPEAQMSIDRKVAKAPNDEAESSDNFIQTGFDLDLDHSGKILSDFSYRYKESEATFKTWGIYIDQRETSTWSATPRYIREDTLGGKDNTFMSGIDFYSTKQDLESFSDAFGTLQMSGTANIQRDTIGIYFTDDFHINDNVILAFGGRHEEVDYDINQADLLFGAGSLDRTVEETENVFSIALTFLYDENSSVFTRINTSYRMPLVDEMVETVEIAPWTYQLQLNNDLKPQTATHYEVGVKHQFTPEISGRVTLFMVDIEDEILLDKITFPPFGSNVNYPETRHQGIEIGGDMSVCQYVNMNGNYSYTEATFETAQFDGNDIPAVPNHKASVGITVKNYIEGLLFNINYTYVGDSYPISDMANMFEKLDSYDVVDAKLSYRWENIKAYITINNIFDEEYSEYAIIGGTPIGREFHPSPERNGTIGLDILF